jgi:hypothetical protein
VLILDSGGISRLAERSSAAAALIRALRMEGLWPPVVCTGSLVESVAGDAGKDANTNRFLKTCHIVERLSERAARRAAFLRTRTRRGSAVAAIVVAMAEPGGTVLTSDATDLRAIASRADGVTVEPV